MRKVKGIWVVIFAVFGINVCAAAEDAAGMIKVSKGPVNVLRAGAALPGKAGVRLFQDDKVHTGADGAVGITLKDGTLLSAGPHSAISLDKFSFDTRTHAGRISVGVKKGTLSVATGKIAKQSPESVDFHTPSSILGVRGTVFVIDVTGGKDE